MATISGAERGREILRILEEQQRISVEDIARRFQVSWVTARHDLTLLAKQGLLVRSRGGAIVAKAGTADPDLDFDIRIRLQADEKASIARAAAKLVGNGEVIALDASSTAFYLAMELSNHRELVVVTNGLRTAIALLRKPHITVILPGGVLRSEAVSLVGELGEDILKRTRIQKGFFSGRGLTPDDGLMDLSPEETRLKRAMVGACSEVIALVDHTKWQRGALLSVASPKQISTVVTDWKTPKGLIEAWRSRGTKVIVGEESSNGAS